MSKIKSAREKKALSLKRDRRNTFGENSKASRKAIPRRKQVTQNLSYGAALSHMTELREGAAERDATEADVLAKTTIVERKRKAFRKHRDTALGVVVKKKLAERMLYTTPR